MSRAIKLSKINAIIVKRKARKIFTIPKKI